MKYAVLILLLLVPCALAATQSNSAALNLEFLSQRPDPVEPGSNVDVRWQISNEGTMTREYVFLLEPTYPFFLDNPETAQVTRTIRGGAGGDDGAIILYYQLRVDESAVEGENTVRLSYYPVGQPNTITTIEQDIRIESIQGQVQVSNVTLNPKQVTVGAPFTIDFDVENLATQFISSVTVTLNTENTSFTPIGGSNQQTVRQISGLSSQRFSFDYFVDAGTSITVQSIPVTVVYYDSNREQVVLTTKIGIPVTSTPRYLVNLQETQIFVPGTRGDIVTSISNVGQSDLKFVRLELLESPEYEIIGSDIEYLGDLESDDFETGQFEVYVNPTDKSDISYTFKITYNDEYDKLYEDQFTLENKLYSQQRAQQIGLISNGGGFWIPLLIVVLLIAGSIWWWRRRK